MSTTTITIVPIVTGDPNAAATVDGNFDEIKDKLETTGLGVGNLKAKFTRHVLTAAKYIASGVVETIIQSTVPSGVVWTIESVTAFVDTYGGAVGGGEVKLYIDSGAGLVLAGSVAVTPAATVVSFVPAPAILQGNWSFRLMWDGTDGGGTSGVTGFCACMYVKDTLVEA